MLKLFKSQVEKLVRNRGMRVDDALKQLRLGGQVCLMPQGVKLNFKKGLGYTVYGYGPHNEDVVAIAKEVLA